MAEVTIAAVATTAGPVIYHTVMLGLRGTITVPWHCQYRTASVGSVVSATGGFAPSDVGLMVTFSGQQCQITQVVDSHNAMVVPIV